MLHILRKPLFKRLLLLLTLLLPGFAAAAELPILQRGVNLSHWLQYEGRQPVTSTDFALIRQAGLDHVRLPFDPVRLGWNPDAAPDAPWANLATLDQIVDSALAAGLAIILDFHPESALRARIETEAKVQSAFVAAWRMLAARYADRASGQLAFELLNEPQYYQTGGALAWQRLQNEALAAVRQQAPAHLVLLSGIQGGSIAGLRLMAPVRDARVRYVFHFYEPMLFTHLNAPWEPFLSGPQGMITGLLYPVTPQVMSSYRLLPGANVKVATDAVRRYVRENWNSTKIAQEIAKASDWAKKNRVALVCTEFGALRKSLDPVSRNNWLRDVRSTLANAGIGWSVWDYADFFGIATATGLTSTTHDGVIVPADPLNPNRQFDTSTLAALGLTPVP